jgi:hypothetical protein
MITLDSWLDNVYRFILSSFYHVFSPVISGSLLLPLPPFSRVTRWLLVEARNYTRTEPRYMEPLASQAKRTGHVNIKVFQYHFHIPRA